MATSDTRQKGAGPPGEESYPAPKYATELPEGSVISPLGITRPPEPGLLDPYRKERSDDEQLAGKVLIKGKTHHGFKYERIVEITQPRTEKGMFQVFKAHFPDAVDEDFSAEPISDEDAEKLEKEWAKELLGKEKDERDRRAQAQTASNSRRKAQEQEDYDALTVAELRERAGTRGIEHKHDWVKDDYVKALKKGK
jgi:hypothetical protein